MKTDQVYFILYIDRKRVVETPTGKLTLATNKKDRGYPFTVKEIIKIKRWINFYKRFPSQFNATTKLDDTCAKRDVQVQLVRVYDAMLYPRCAKKIPKVRLDFEKEERRLKFINRVKRDILFTQEELDDALKRLAKLNTKLATAV